MVMCHRLSGLSIYTVKANIWEMSPLRTPFGVHSVFLPSALLQHAVIVALCLTDYFWTFHALSWAVAACKHV